MLTPSEVDELTKLYQTVREARRVLLLSDMPYGDITELPADGGVVFWHAVAVKYNHGYLPHTEALLRANILERFHGNKVFMADSLENFSPAERRSIAYAIEKVNIMGEIEAAAVDLLAVLATRKNSNADDGFSVALLQLHELVSTTQPSGRALQVLEAEGHASGQVVAATRRQLVDELERVIKDDPEFAKKLTKAVHNARDAATPAGSGIKVSNTSVGAVSGTLFQVGTMIGNINQVPQPAKPQDKPSNPDD